MVLESIIAPLRAEKKPWDMFFIGLLYASVAMFISINIFGDMAGLLAVFLTVSAAVPMMYNTMKIEEEKDVLGAKESKLLKEHAHALSFFLFLFLGIVIAFSLWYVFLPPEMGQNVFSVQTNTIRGINANAVSGFSARTDLFGRIFFNNIKVLAFCILFAFFYGCGAIFILTWNASVIAVAVGEFVRRNMSAYASLLGLSGLASYFHVFSLGLLRYLTHGIPEIAGYFIGGLAGGIISVAVIRRDFRTSNFERIMLDSANLVLISIAVLFVAALIETFVTPMLF